MNIQGFLCQIPDRSFPKRQVTWIHLESDFGSQENQDWVQPVALLVGENTSNLPDCHSQEHWSCFLPNSALMLWCKFRGKCSGQHGLQRKNTSHVYRCLLSSDGNLSNRVATLSCLQSGNESTQGLLSFQNRRQQQQCKALCNLAMSDSQQTKSSNHPQGHPPERVSLHLPSAEPEAPWGLGTIPKHLWPQSPGQNLAHSRFSTHACWTLEAKLACFSCLSFICMGFWKCILHFFNYFSSKSKKVFGYCFLKRWFTDEDNSLHIDPRVGCFWGLCPQGDKKRPSPRESLTYKGMSHQRGPKSDRGLGMSQTRPQQLWGRADPEIRKHQTKWSHGSKAGAAPPQSPSEHQAGPCPGT